MKIDSLKIEYGYGGRAIVDMWVKAHTADDVDGLIAWLQMAKGTMRQWEKIYMRALHKRRKRRQTKMKLRSGGKFKVNHKSPSGRTGEAA